MKKNNLLEHTADLHTTIRGLERIRKNLGLIEEDPVLYCRRIMEEADCHIYRDGKNFYCEYEDIRITVNASSYTIITAHRKKTCHLTGFISAMKRQ